MKGVFTALISPFSADGSVLDLSAYEKILKDQADAGVAGVIACGTTGETPTLTTDEKKTLIDVAIKTLKGTGVKVLAGTGSNNTSETVDFSKWAAQKGVDGILVVTPYYNKPSQAGLIEHFTAVADSVNCEVMLYNVPGRTGISLTAETVCTLSKHPRILSIKEATGNVAFTSEILEHASLSGQKIDVLSGDDATYLPLLSVGAVGVVSVASNLFPRAMVRIQKSFEAGNIAEARSLHQRFYPLFRDLFVESNPVPTKYAMELAGFCSRSVRKPLVPMTPKSTEILTASLKRCGIRPGEKS
jgi:4-hydroxy-tetrahydrodipicolinate synthase